MEVRTKVNSPFLFDTTTDNIVGIKNSDQSEMLFADRINEGVTVVDGVRATLTTDMTNATCDITLTAVEYGIAGHDISVEYLDPGGANKALSVTVSGKAITVNLATGAGSAISSTGALVKAAINTAAGHLVTAEDEGAGSGIVNAVAAANLAGGVDCTPGTIGSIRFKADGSLLYIKTAAQVWKKASLAGL